MAEYNSMVDDYEYHELANLFPLMNKKEFNDLVEDIDKNGLLEAIVLYEDKILDGRDRHKACKKLNIKPQFREFKEWYRNIDPLDFVMAKNLKRRHLNSAQKSEVALKYLKMEEKKTQERKKNLAEDIIVDGGRSENMRLGINDPSSKKIKKDEKKGRSVDIIAKKMQMSPRTIQKAKKIKKIAKEDKEINELWDKALDGEISIESVVKKTEKKQLKKNGMSEKDIISKEKQKEVRKIISPIFLKLSRSYFDDCNDAAIEYAENIAKKIEKFIHKEYHYLF